ncbi:hypothetical protein D3C86_1746600 [compost metagenome]
MSVRVPAPATDGVNSPEGFVIPVPVQFPPGGVPFRIWIPSLIQTVILGPASTTGSGLTVMSMVSLERQVPLPKV